MKNLFVGIVVAVLLGAAPVLAYQCRTIVIQQGASLVTCVVCTDSYGNTTVRCF